MFLGTLLRQSNQVYPWEPKNNSDGRVFFVPVKKVELDVFRVPKNIHQYVFVRTENILMYVFLVGIRADVSRFGARRYLCVRVLPGAILPVLPSPIPVMKIPPRHITVSDRT